VILTDGTPLLFIGRIEMNYLLLCTNDLAPFEQCIEIGCDSDNPGKHGKNEGALEKRVPIIEVRENKKPKANEKYRNKYPYTGSVLPGDRPMGC
jgi:hypothetical protein